MQYSQYRLTLSRWDPDKKRFIRIQAADAAFSPEFFAQAIGADGVLEKLFADRATEMIRRELKISRSMAKVGL